jgi:hypothetical protein
LEPSIGVGSAKIQHLLGAGPLHVLLPDGRRAVTITNLPFA